MGVCITRRLLTSRFFAGGFAFVFVAQALDTGKEYALKVRSSMMMIIFYPQARFLQNVNMRPYQRNGSTRIAMGRPQSA